MSKKLCAWLSVLSLTVSALLPSSAWAAAITGNESKLQQQAAETLYELGLFRGVGSLSDGTPDFDLNGDATRGAAVTMLVRLLGAEEEAQSAQYPHPFTDTADWVSPYVGYAYANGITSGTSSTTFGTNDPITTTQFLTLILRAMGYSEVDWRDPYPMADQVGLEYFEGECLRGNLAYICYTALFCTLNQEMISLRQKLGRQGVIQDPYAEYSYGPVTPLATSVQVNRQDELLDAVYRAAEGRYLGQVQFQVTPEHARDWYDFLRESIFSVPSLYEVSMSLYNSNLLAKLNAYDSYHIMAWLEGKVDSITDTEMATLHAAVTVCNNILTEDMSEFEIVKAFHDWLVNHTQYDFAGAELSHQAAGPLLNGASVCDGYTRAFDLLCYLVGIDCMRVVGTAEGKHAWNKVKVDGIWYNIDITWDDPVNDNYDILTYKYFLVSDETLAQDHSWSDHNFYPACTQNHPHYVQYQEESYYTQI